MKKYMKKSEIWTFGIGLFGVALMTGWMPDYTATYLLDIRERACFLTKI